MSITVLETPSDVMQIGNDIPLKLRTDSLFSVTGSQATVTFTFSNIETIAGRTFTFAYGDISLQFFTAAAPDDSGLQIRCASGGQPVDLWMQEFALDLMRNYYINRDFDCVVDTDANTIVLTAKEKGIGYNVTHAFNNVTGVTITDVDGVDPVPRENLELVCITELYNGSFWIKLAEDRIPPDASGDVRFLFQDLFHPELMPEYTWPEEREVYYSLRGNHIKRYRLTYGELYDDTVRRLSEASVYRAIIGTFDYKMIAGLNGQQYSFTDFITTYKSFLTWQPTSKKINRTQPEKLFFLVFNNVASLELHIKVYFTDGTDSGDQELVTIAGVSRYDVYELMVGYNQIDFTKINAKAVSSYEIWLEDNAGNIQSQTRTYTIDPRSYRNERIFLFRNSFGGYDTLRATGRKKHTNEYERLILEKNLANFTLQEQYQVLEQSVFSINTGWLSFAQRNWLRELLISKEVYEIIGGYKFPIILQDEKSELKDDENYLYSLEINYKYAFKDPAFTGDYTSMPLLAENLEVLLNEDGEPLYA